MISHLPFSTSWFSFDWLSHVAIMELRDATGNTLFMYYGCHRDLYFARQPDLVSFGLDARHLS